MEFDEIHNWTEVKLDIIGEYAIPYMDIMRSHKFTAHYIDGFSGAGLHLSKQRHDIVLGSPLRALDIPNPFDSYYFVDLDSNKADFLENICKERFPGRNIEVLTGDCNNVLMEILPRFSYETYDRLLCLLDPYGLDLNWEVIEKMGTMGIVDLILHFPMMDINRNAIWKNPEKVPQSGIERMNAFWGDETWRDIAYKPSRQRYLFGDPLQEKQENKIIAKAFKNRLKEKGKFKFVPDPIPLKNKKNSVIYYLFFASQNETADTIASYLFGKYEK